MKKINLLIFLCVINGFLFANTNNLTNANDYYLTIRNNLNKNMNINTGDSEVIKNKKTKIDTYLDTTIYSDIENYHVNNIIQKAQKTNVLADNIAYQRKIQEKYVFNNQKNKAKQIPLDVRGYCTVTNSVKVYFSDAFVQMKCDLENIKTDNIYHANVFVKLMPDYKREMLIAFPVYADINGARYNAVGYFLNATKTSLNIADKVDGVRIKKLLLKGLLVESDIAYNQAMQYLNDLRASETSSSVTYVPNGDNQAIPVQSQTTQKPHARDYINTGIVQSIAALIKMLGEDSLYELRPLFYVNNGDVVYTEMILQKQGVFNRIEKIMNNQQKNIQQNNQNYQKELMKIPNVPTNYNK